MDAELLGGTALLLIKGRPGLLLGGQCPEEGAVRVALAGLPAGLLLVEGPHLLHSGGTAVCSSDDLGKGVAVFNALRVLYPGQGLVHQLLSHDDALMAGLKHGVETVGAGGHLLNVLDGFHDSVALGDSAPLVALSLGRCASTGREDRADHLLLVLLLGGAHLKAPDLVNAEPGAILDGLIEHGRCGLDQPARLGVVVWASMQLTRDPLDALLACTLPGGREKCLGLVHGEVRAEEAGLALLPDNGLLVKKRAQHGHVGGANVRGHEELCVVTPVAQAGLVQVLEERLLVFWQR
mmetsp:Transcript_55531/g.125169  ORF Transcript_55531/g.125169 Transcript_55531/m.125169 type:complete len:294 (-) Transcript_55531:1538-2419(-)